jgi:uridine kinase
MKSIVIVICGRSCCGKSTIFKKLISDFSDTTELISAEHFIK